MRLKANISQTSATPTTHCTPSPTWLAIRTRTDRSSLLSVAPLLCPPNHSSFIPLPKLLRTPVPIRFVAFRDRLFSSSGALQLTNFFISRCQILLLPLHRRDKSPFELLLAALFTFFDCAEKRTPVQINPASPHLLLNRILSILVVQFYMFHPFVENFMPMAWVFEEPPHLSIHPHSHRSCNSSIVDQSIFLLTTVQVRIHLVADNNVSPTSSEVSCATATLLAIQMSYLLVLPRSSPRDLAWLSLNLYMDLLSSTYPFG